MHRHKMFSTNNSKEIIYELEKLLLRTWVPVVPPPVIFTHAQITLGLSELQEPVPGDLFHMIRKGQPFGEVPFVNEIMKTK